MRYYETAKLRVRWILKFERIRKWILRFFTKQTNPGPRVSWGVKGTEESTLEADSLDPLDPLMHHHPTDLGFTCLVKKRKIGFRILSDLRIQSFFMSYHGLYMAF